MDPETLTNLIEIEKRKCDIEAERVANEKAKDEAYANHLKEYEKYCTEQLESTAKSRELLRESIEVSKKCNEISMQMVTALNQIADNIKNHV